MSSSQMQYPLSSIKVRELPVASQLSFEAYFSHLGCRHPSFCSKWRTPLVFFGSIECSLPTFYSKLDWHMDTVYICMDPGFVLFHAIISYQDHWDCTHLWNHLYQNKKIRLYDRSSNWLKTVPIGWRTTQNQEIRTSLFKHLAPYYL